MPMTFWIAFRLIHPMPIRPERKRRKLLFRSPRTQKRKLSYRPRDDRVVLGEGVLSVEGSEEQWEAVLEEEPLFRRRGEEVERGVKLSDVSAPLKRYALGWIPMRGAGRASLDRTLPLRKQKNAEGREEIVAVWNLSDAQGEQTDRREIVFPIYTADELDRIVKRERQPRRKRHPLPSGFLPRAVPPKEGWRFWAPFCEKERTLWNCPWGVMWWWGLFPIQENAEHFAEVVQNKGYSVRVGYNSQVRRYYVTLYESS